MTAITYGAGTGATAPAAATSRSAPERKGLLEGFLSALYESRIRAARREINRHLHLVPKDLLEQTGYLPSSGGSKLPFA